MGESGVNNANDDSEIIVIPDEEANEIYLKMTL